MKKKILISISVVVFLLIVLIVRARTLNAPTTITYNFVKPENYKDIIDNSVDPATLTENNILQEDIKTSNTQTPNANDLLGTYTSDNFGGKKLKIVIEKVTYAREGEAGYSGAQIFSVIGYNQVGANKRSVTGEYIQFGAEDQLFLEEPGTDKWDGKFIITINTNNRNVDGEWNSNNGKLTHKFQLIKN